MRRATLERRVRPPPAWRGSRSGTVTNPSNLVTFPHLQIYTYPQARPSEGRRSVPDRSPRSEAGRAAFTLGHVKIVAFAEILLRTGDTTRSLRAFSPGVSRRRSSKAVSVVYGLARRVVSSTAESIVSGRES